MRPPKPPRTARPPEYYINKWVGYARSTERADRALVERAVRRIYARAGLAPPETILWGGSPFEGALLAQIAHGTRLRNLEDFAWWTYGGTDSVMWARNLVKNGVWGHLLAQLGGTTGVRVEEALKRLRGLPGESRRNTIADTIHTLAGGSAHRTPLTNYASTISYGEFTTSRARPPALIPVSNPTTRWLRVTRDRFATEGLLDEVVGPVGRATAPLELFVRTMLWECLENLSYPTPHVMVPMWGAAVDSMVDRSLYAPRWGLRDEAILMRGASMMWPFYNLVVFAERPTEIHLDSEGRPHNETAAAIVYPDGWRLHAIRGVAVPKKVAESADRITGADIEAQDNVEVRRIMLERYGLERYLSRCRKIASDEYGTLYRKNFGDDEALTLLRVTNSTPEPDGSYKYYVLRVPPATFTPTDAVAWSFGVSGRDYAPLEES